MGLPTRGRTLSLGTTNTRPRLSLLLLGGPEPSRRGGRGQVEKTGIGRRRGRGRREMEGVDGRGGEGLVGGGDGGGDACGGGGGGGRVRVLVVDDSPLDRKIVERLLLRSGDLFDVVSVDGGRKALEYLGWNGRQDDSHDTDGHDVDIILTDYCMPQMNGYELLKTVKEHNHRRSIPVVVMSSENDPQRISRCRTIGAADFILKPLQRVDVQQLWNYARPPDKSATKASGKRKLPLDVITESSDSERRPRPRLAGVAVA